MADPAAAHPSVAAVAARPVGRVRSTLALYRAQMRTTIIGTFQYRVNNAIELVLMLAEPLVYLMVWRIVAEEQGGEVDGFTPARFAAYYIAWSLVRTATQSGSPHNWEGDIRDGRMSGLLMRPMHPIHQDMARWMGFVVVRVLTWLPAGAVLCIAFRPQVDTSPGQVAVFGFALASALVMRTIVNDAVGVAAFWVTRILAIGSLVQVVELLTSGRLVPLALMPDWAQAVSWVLPFRWMFSFPIEVLIGPMSGADLAGGVAMQVVWLVALYAGFQLMWRRGVRRYGAFGG